MFGVSYYIIIRVMIQIRIHVQNLSLELCGSPEKGLVGLVGLNELFTWFLSCVSFPWLVVWGV